MLRHAEVSYDYELESYPWEEVIPNARCPECDLPAVATRSYTPDFFLSNGVIIEAKGRFTPHDRKIALAMRDGGVVIKLLFQYNNKLSRKSKTRYSDWCTKNDLDFAVRTLPEAWLI